jgi:hypothetical protein
MKLARSAVWLLLISVLQLSSLGTPAANATLVLGGLGPVCISVSDLAENGDFETRNDLAKRVRDVVRIKVEELRSARSVWAEPDCIKVNQPGFDSQLVLKLSVKRQTSQGMGRDWNLVIVGGGAADGPFEDRALQPVVTLQEDSTSDDTVVDALVAFLDRTLMAALRPR